MLMSMEYFLIYFIVSLQRNDGPYYRPIQHNNHQQMYRPPPQSAPDNGLMGSISTGLNSLLTNLFG